MSEAGFWGGAGIEKVVFDFIRERVPTGSTILELGSGDGTTRHFSKFYKVFSVESDPHWVGRHPSKYIYAPIRDGWYDLSVLQKKLPKQYDLIFIDGPPGKSESSKGRSPFLDNIDLFRTDVPMVFHNTFRTDEKELAIRVAHSLDQPVVFYRHGEPADTWAVVGSFPALS